LGGIPELLIALALLATAVTPTLVIGKGRPGEDRAVLLGWKPASGKDRAVTAVLIAGRDRPCRRRWPVPPRSRGMERIAFACPRGRT